MEIGSIIRSIRQSKQLTLEDIGARSGLSATYISAIERGQKKDFRFSTLKALADALEMPLQAIMLMSLDEGDIPVMESLVPHVRDDLKDLFYRVLRPS